MRRQKFRNPVPAVDLIIEVMDGRKIRGIVLIERRNPPPGWALPGGFVDYGETLEAAAVREAREETSLDVELFGQFHAYSDPARDPRLHTVSTVFIARAKGEPKAGDDARNAAVIDPRDRDVPLAFDHRKILDDYLEFKKGRDPWLNSTARKSIRKKTPTSPKPFGSSARSKRT
jgi:ADP-ribose pyrophosphatase YjhB (NUDIX family)